MRRGRLLSLEMSAEHSPRVMILRGGRQFPVGKDPQGSSCISSDFSEPLLS